MSTTTSSTPKLPKDNSEQEVLINNDEYCKDLISGLPTEKCNSIIYLCKYKGYWLGTKYQLSGIIWCQNHFRARDNDVLLATLPKSGTTWLKAIMFALANRKHHPINQNGHPLLHQNPHSLVPFIEIPTGEVAAPGSSSYLSTRLLSTHIPVSLLPPSVLNSGCKVVYLCRNLKDVFVSFWHHLRRSGSETPSLEEAFDKFCDGISLGGPVWDHALGYWKESLGKPDKILFLKYEEMKEQPELRLKRLAEFMGCPISPEEDEGGLVDGILRLCSFDHLSNLEVNKKGKWLVLGNQVFFRKGEIGDWKNYLTNEMAQRLDRISAHKFHGSGGLML